MNSSLTDYGKLILLQRLIGVEKSPRSVQHIGFVHGLFDDDNNDFLCANILEDQAQWRDKTKGLSNCVNVEQCVSR